MVDAYKCKCGNKFDIEREGDRAARSAECRKCGKQAKWKPQFSTPRPRPPDKAPRPPAPPPRSRTAAIGVGPGTKITGSKFYAFAGEGVEAGVRIDEGADVQLEELYTEGGRIGVDNAGDLDAPGMEAE